MNYKKEIEILTEQVAEKLSVTKNQTKEEKERIEIIRKQIINEVDPDYK